MVDTAVSLLLDINVGNTHILGVGLLQTVQFETGIVANISLYNLCGEKIKVVGGVVTEKHRCLGTLLKYDEHTTVDHQIDIGTQNVDHLDSAVGFDVLGNIDEHAVLGQHCVEGRERIASQYRQSWHSVSL